MRDTRLPPLNALRVFMVAAQHLSFTIAAEELHVTQGAVSRQVKLLEEHYGTPLFTRQHRSLSLTAEGAQLLAEVTPAFNTIAAASNRLKRLSGVFRLQVSPTLAARCMIPILPAFEQQHPDIRLQLTTSVARQDLIQDDFDAILTFLNHDQTPPRYAQAEFEETMLPVCSPQLLAQPLLTPEHIYQLPMIWTSGDGWDWFYWAEQLRLPPPPSASLVFDTVDMALNAAIAGRGVTLTDPVFIKEELESGLLVVAEQELAVSAGNYYWISNPDHLGAKQLEQLRQWFAERIYPLRS